MIAPGAFDGMLPGPDTQCAVCHHPIGPMGWVGYGHAVCNALKTGGAPAIVCWDCSRAEHRATQELIARHHDEHRLLVAIMLARTTPLGEQTR